MAYQALYRKYRPTNFDEVVGQKHIIQTLKNAVAKDRIGHAYLFCGPRGTGKTSIAKIFAKMLNCEDKQHAPCGVCTSCKMAAEHSYPDIIEIDAASNNGVDEVRDLIERVKYAPMQGKYKVYIIDEVHMMSTGAFNALLKTIEEPPEHVIFIFATTEPHKVLPTIISRCQRYDFAKVSVPDIQHRLSVVCQREQIAADDSALALIAQLSDGGMRDALSILDQCVAYCTSTITQQDVRDIYGIMTMEDIGKLYLNLYEHNVEQVISTLQHANDNGMDLKRFTADFIKLLKDSVIVNYSEKTQLVNDMNKSVIQKYMEPTPLSFKVTLMNELMDTYNKFNFASSVLDYLEGALLKTISKSYEQNPSEIVTEPLIQKKTVSHEQTSEKSEIIEKNIKKAENIEDSEDMKKSDVSHETIIESEIVKKEPSEIIFSDDYIEALLVGADKNERKKDSEMMNMLDMFLVDIQYAKFAASLRNGQIIAAGSNYLIFCMNSDLESKEINEMEASEGYEAFTLKWLGTEKKVFAIDSIQNKRVILQFKNHMNTNSLPDPIPVVIKKEDAEEKAESSEEDELKKIFPTIEIVDD